MKRIALLCCISLPFLAQAQTSQVYIAGSNYPVTFADTNLSAQVQQRMAVDLTFIFSFASSCEELKDNQIEPDVFQTSNTLPLFSWEHNHMFIVATNNITSIRIGKVVSDKYLKTFTWMDANSNTVQKAREFIATLNSPDLLSKPTQTLLNLYHFEPLSGLEENNPPSGAETRENLTAVFFPFNYPGFSALHFYFKEVPEVNMELPLLFLPMVSKSNPSEWIAFPVGFYKGKWGIGGFPNPIGNIE